MRTLDYASSFDFKSNSSFCVSDNPCPHLGNVVTIKLSESQENVHQEGSIITMMVETHFQMNYSTGEWKRIKKLRKAEDVPALATPVQASTPQQQHATA